MICRKQMGRLRGVCLWLLTVVLAVTLGFPAVFAEANEGASYRDGTYEGTGTGRNGAVTMSVTITDGKLSAIETVSHGEDTSYWEEALQITEAMVASGSAEVDTISGATASSNGIKEAVRKALALALIPDNPEAFASGDGSESNPYVIETADQLAAFAKSVDEGTTYEGQFIRLGADIGLTGRGSWNPIGAEGAPNKNKDKLFNGTFDGDGHSISGLTITAEVADADSQNMGLFSTLNTAARICNLAILDIDVQIAASATARAGGLAGDTVGNNNGLGAAADSISVTGKLSIVSENDSMLFAGGLFGRTMAGAAAVNCWTDVDVHAEAKGAGFPSAYAGGIIGMAGNNTVIAASASFGPVFSSTPKGETLVGYAGGIAGMFPGMLLGSYAAGDITYGRLATSPHTWAGALVGQLTAKGAADAVYYASDTIIRLNAFTDDGCTESLLSGASGTSEKTAFATITANGTPTREEMAGAAFAETLNGQMQTVYDLLKNAGLADTLTLREWAVSEGRVLPVGERWYNKTPDSGIFASGSGTDEDPFLIETADQLFAFAASLGEALNYEGYTVALASDIDLSEREWTPVGLSEYGFAGTFDGRNHVIRGMHKGTDAEAVPLNSNEPYFALFGVLEHTAIVRNVVLTDVLVNATYPASSYVGGIAGYMAGISSDNYAGAWIDNCHVSGKMTLQQGKGNLFLGGIAAYQYKGAITNCSTNLALSGTVDGEDLAEVGGLVALVNRGLVANSYALGDIYGSGNREDGKEGMAVISSLAAVDAGAVVGCYGSGSHTTKEFSNYAGMVSGWVTGVGKAYSSWYALDSVMTVNSEKVNPPEAIGTRVPGGVSEDGLVYTGGVVDDLHGYAGADYANVAAQLNEKFATYPIDVTLYGLDTNVLRTWTFEDGLVRHAEEIGTVTYVQPEAEKYEEPRATPKDGIWYGRDTENTTIVRITVAEGEILTTELLSGAEGTTAYEEALAKATEKAVYGDFSTYDAPDASRFGGGKGTKESPYLIANAEQLEYLSTSINEDNSWEGFYFRQTADISLAGMDWIPIGWAIEGKIDEKFQTYCAYPFEGNYDGGGYVIRELTIGSAEEPSGLLTLGLFGLTNGEYLTNEVPTEETRCVELKNIHLRDVAVFGNVPNQVYAGTLVGSAQYGISLDHCDATGSISCETLDSHCRVGGLLASGLRGKMTNCWTNVHVRAVTDAGRSYGAGLVAMSNRLTIVNAYTLGDVEGGATSNNMTFVGGIDGMEGGVHVNCYSSGNVTSFKTTSGIGANNGLVGGISVNKASYYNSDSALTVQGSPAEVKASGANYSGATDEATAKTAEEITSAAFAEELNANASHISQLLSEVSAELAGGSHLVYYTGDGSDLATWSLLDGKVRFAPQTQEITGIASVYNKTFGNKAFRLTPAAKTTLTYASDNTAVAEVTRLGKVTLKGAGIANITVTAVGNAQYEEASVVVKIRVAKAASTITLASKKAVYTGKSISIGKAKVMGSSGKVIYRYYSDAACKNTVSSHVNAGTYYVRAKVAEDVNYKAATCKAVKLVITKASQKVTAVTSKLTFSATKLKKAAQTAQLKFTISGKGKVTFPKSAGNAKIKVAKNGKVTVAKGMPKGTYTIKVKVVVAATKNYTAASAVKTVKVIVK